jgi:uncharacterized protein (TIGR00297 family)
MKVSVESPIFTARKLTLIGTLAFAFLLPFLTWRESLGCPLFILLFNLAILPRFGADVNERTGQVEAGAKPSGRAGLILYPVSILALILVFRHHMEAAAAAWAILALGDGVASIAGQAVGGPRLLWNPRKTWSGFAGFVVAGTTGAYMLTRWVNPHLAVDKTFIVSLAASIVGALVETLPILLDDNLTVPLASGGFIFCAYLIERSALASNMPYLGVRIILAVAVSACFSFAALAIRSVDRSGALAGFLLGIAIYMGYGWKTFSVAALFFFLGSAATKLGYAKKLQRGVAEGRGGARGWREALANTLAGAFFSILVITTHHEAAFLAAFVATFAEAAGDTVSSEIGQWLSSRAYLVATLEPVPAGENGAISFAGSTAGLAASAAVVGLGLALRLCGAKAALIALAAAMAANILDSVLGATLEHRGLLTNDVVNFAATTFAGALALALMLHFHL